MTPLGLHLRKLRSERGITQQQMATGIGVSPAYLSSLENGKRGRPSWALLQRMVGYLGVIWDEADALQRAASLSDPKVTLDTSELSAEATELANRFAHALPAMSEKSIRRLIAGLKDEDR